MALTSANTQDFDGEERDVRAGREYFRRRFVRLAQKANAKEREIYIQYVESSVMHQRLGLAGELFADALEA